MLKVKYISISRAERSRTRVDKRGEQGERQLGDEEVPKKGKFETNLNEWKAHNECERMLKKYQPSKSSS